MDLSDMFLDEPPVVQARAGGKFQPRAKQRPRKETSASVPAAVKDVTASAAPEKQGCLINNEALSSDAPAVQNMDNVVSANPLISDVPECNNDPGSNACFNLWEKDVAFELCSHNDAEKLAMRNAGADGKFQPKADPGLGKKNYGSEPSSLPGDVSEEATTMSVGFDAGQDPEFFHVVDACENQGVNPSQQGALRSMPIKHDGSLDSHSTLAKSVGENADIFSGLECLDQLLVQSSNVTGAAHKPPGTIDMDGQPENRKTRPEDAEAFSNVEADEMVFDAAIGTGQHVGKFKPKPQSQKGVVKPSPSSPQGTVIDSVMHPPNAQWVSAGNDCLEGGSVPVFPSDDILGYPSMDMGDFVSLDASTSEQPMAEETMNAAETSNSYAALSGDASKMPEGGGSESMKLNSQGTYNPSGKSTSSFSPDEENQDGRLPRQLRKRAPVPQLDDEPDEDTYSEGSPASDPPTTAADDDVEDISLKKGARRKSKNPVAENKRPVRKSKKVNEASDQQAKRTPKKFPHATRRKRRCVDKALLETPEDEIDYERVPLKDLILLAEYRERLAKKDALASKVSASNASQNPFNEDDAHNEDGFDESEHYQGSGNDQKGQGIQKSSGFFNYHSYMKKEPRAKWSKQETELFYEAIQQFGTDFSLIQQLFPGRSRKQMKAKYRLEERKHPLRMSEASGTRAKDLSHFVKLVQQLQQAAAAKAEHGSAEDDANGMVGEEDGPTPETNVEATEYEKGDATVEEQGTDVPLKSDESDYDADMWDTYQSAF